MARSKPQTAAQDVEPSGLDEFHPDTTHNPAPAAKRAAGAHPEPGFRPPALTSRHGKPIPDRRKRLRD